MPKNLKYKGKKDGKTGNNGYAENRAYIPVIDSRTGKTIKRIFVSKSKPQSSSAKVQAEWNALNHILDLVAQGRDIENLKIAFGTPTFLDVAEEVEDSEIDF